MAGYSYTVIIGNVGRDPELRYTSNGVAVCDFSVAVSRRWKVESEQREETTWFKVSCWRGLAETCAEHVHKGMQIMVAGRVSADAYIAEGGTIARASLSLTALDVQFLSRRAAHNDDVPGDHTGDNMPDEPEDLPF